MKALFSPSKLFASVAALACVAVSFSVRADTIAQWTWETTLTSTFSVTGTGPGTFSPDVTGDGAVGSATGVHSLAASVWTSPAGDGSPRSLSGNDWSQGDYFQFAVTPGSGFTYSGINISYEQNGSATGPKTFYFAYSTDGSTFTTVGSDYALTSGITWNSSTAGLPTAQSFDLSAATALNTASTWYFRVYDDSPTTGGNITGGNIGTGGTGRIDDFTVTATAVAAPEPQAFALIGGFALLALRFIRRKS